MQAFFLVAGFFAAQSLQRRGTSQWLMDRSERLGVPLLFGLAVLTPLQLLLIQLSHSVFAGDPAHPLPTRPGFLFHLWFIVDLLLFSAFTACVRRLDRHRYGSRWLLRASGAFSAGGPAAALAGLLLLSAYVRGVGAIGQWIDNVVVAGSAHPFWLDVCDPAAILAYLPYFALGYLLRRDPVLCARFAHPSIASCVAGLAITALVAYDGVERSGVPLVTSLLSPLATIQMIRVGLRLAAWPGWQRISGTRVLLEGSYTIYLVHLPVALAMSIIAIACHLPALAGFLFVASTTMAFSIVIYHASSRSPLANYVLNGIRMPAAHPLRRRLSASASA
jgi:glucan biosynthesis protein C